MRKTRQGGGDPPKIKRAKKRGPSGLQTAGTALNVFGALPMEIHFLYYLGALPFVTAFLYFWFDMSQSAYASDRLVAWSLLLPLLFVWMKCWHTVYLNAVSRWMYGTAAVDYSLRGILRMVLFNLAVQPLGFIVMPIALIFGVPFMAAGFFFQDVLLSEKLYQEGFAEKCADSLRCARMNPGQGFTLMWLFSPWQMGAAVLMICFITFITRYFSLEVADDQSVSVLLAAMISQIALFACVLSPFASLLAGGIVLSFIAVWWTVEHLLGLEVPLSYGIGTMLLNTSFMAVVYFLVFMLLDPLIKIATVVRRFEYNSRESGGDILFALQEFLQRQGRSSALLCIAVAAWLVLPPVRAFAESRTEREVPAFLSSAVSTDGGGIDTSLERDQRRRELDAALDETLRKSRYTWRMPKKLSLDNRDDEMPGWYRRLVEFMKKPAEWLRGHQREWRDWFEKWLAGRDRGESAGFPWLGMSVAETAFYLLLALFLLTVMVMLLKWLRSRRRLMTATAAQEVPAGKVDIHGQSVSPEDLPPDEWMELAASLVAAGDYRAAIRALFLGVLARLGRSGFITLRAYKSNYDYRRELELRTGGRGDILDLFGWLCRLMECTWYGFVPVNEQMWRSFQLQSAAIRRKCEPEPSAGEEPEAAE